MNFARTLNTWRAERRTAHQLNRLSDRELEDLGFARGDIPELARRSAAR